MKVLLKYPFKFQDLVLIELTKLYMDPHIEVETTEFNEDKFNGDLTSFEIILGLHKDLCKVGSYLISKCSSYNRRDLEYIDFLRFNGMLASKKAIVLKSALSEMNAGLSNVKDKEKKVGVYNPLSILSMIEDLKGVENFSEEYKSISDILSLWLSSVAEDKPEMSILDSSLLKNPLEEALKNNFSEIQSLESFLDGSHPIKSYSLNKNMLVEVKYLLNNPYKSSSKSHIYNIAQNSTLQKWITLWVKSRKSFYISESHQLDLWNRSDSSREFVVINTTNSPIPNWKEFSKHEDVMFFVTPEMGTSNWSIISVKPGKFPLLDEVGLAYWVHVSRFLAKFDSYQKVNNYLDYLLSLYKDELISYFANE